jgi:hypothetical protein
MATQTDPVQQLAAIINRLYDLSNDPNVPQAQQQAITLQAHNLRGYLVELVSLKLNATDAAYQGMMTNVTNVTAALNSAEQTIQGYVTAVATAAQIVAAVNNLVQQAVQLGITAGKLAVA